MYFRLQRYTFLHELLSIHHTFLHELSAFLYIFLHIHQNYPDSNFEFSLYM